MSDREEYVRKIKQAKSELPYAGKYHRRDLIKHIHRMERALKIYDNYQRNAGA